MHDEKIAEMMVAQHAGKSPEERVEIMQRAGLIPWASAPYVLAHMRALVQEAMTVALVQEEMRVEASRY